jgi:hypothetical protein
MYASASFIRLKREAHVLDTRTFSEYEMFFGLTNRYTLADGCKFLSFAISDEHLHI